MEQLVMALYMAAMSLMELPKVEPPKFEVVEQKVIANMECVNPKDCQDLYFFYAHKEEKIYIAKGINFKFTYSQGELLREIGRHILYKNKIYHPNNTCKTNGEMEASLQDMELDFFKAHISKNKYLMPPDGGIPSEKKHLGKRIWFCNPKAYGDVKNQIGA